MKKKSEKSTKTEEEKALEKLSRKEKIEKESKELINRVMSGNTKKMVDKVAYLLNNYNEVRNSDDALTFTFWQLFENETFAGGITSLMQYRKLTKPSSMIRARAKIQNDYKLFQADPTVEGFRKGLAQEKRKEVVDDKPEGIGVYQVFIDETGKNQQYLAVGSLWILDPGISTALNRLKLIDWRKANKANKEFHFSKMTVAQLGLYKAFVLKFIELYPAISFKIIVVKNTGLTDQNKALTDLTYHLIKDGIDHEDKTRRAPLPRRLQVMIDNESEGSDALKIANIKERLTAQNIKGLYLDQFSAVDSVNNDLVQIVDLFTAAFNRKLNPQETINHKDEFSDFILTVLNFDFDSIDKNNTSIDHSKIFNLDVGKKEADSVNNESQGQAGSTGTTSEPVKEPAEVLESN